MILDLIYELPILEKPFPRCPFANQPLATSKTYLDLHTKALSKDDRQISQFEIETGYSLDKEFWSELALHTQVVIKNSPLNFFHGRVLYSTLMKFINTRSSNNNSPLIILETGTARGFSSLCMARALTISNQSGVVITVDCLPHEESIFWNCIDDNNGPCTRAELLSKWPHEIARVIFLQAWTKSIHKRIGLKRIHFAFLDAQHTKKSVLQEFQYVACRQTKGDIIVFDDVTPCSYPGVCEAVDEIQSNYPYSVNKFNFTGDRGYAIAVREV